MCFINITFIPLKDNIYENTIESSFESLNDWSQFFTINEVKEWFIKKRQCSDMKIIDIPLNETKDWIIDKTTGNISHKSNDFFRILFAFVEYRFLCIS